MECAQDSYPSKPVRMVVSFSAGGPTDTVARVMGARMAELLGQPFVVENRARAGGNIGADIVAKALADPVVFKRLQEVGVDPTPGGTPEKLGEFIRAELAKWAPIIRASGAQVD
jgi:tripartite-type tricarboxylate transporter receptor subunit TctC